MLRKSFRTIFLALGLTGLVTSLYATSSLTDQAPEISLSPIGKQTVDGLRSPEEDRLSMGMCGFTDIGVIPQRLFPADAKFNIATDGRTLFLSAQCEVGPQGVLKRAQKGRGGERSFLDDSFEFIVIPFPKEEDPVIYHLILNYNGSYMAAAKRRTQNQAWKPVYEHRSSVKDKLWTFELSLPLKQFGLDTLRDGQQIGLRFGRNWRRLKPEFGGAWGRQTAWQQKYSPYFTPIFLPKLTYYAEAPVVRFLSLRDKADTNLRLSIYNPGKTSMRLVLTHGHIPQNSQPVSQRQTITLPAGTTRVCDLGGQHLSKDELCTTYVNVQNSDGTRTYYRRSFLWQPRKQTCFQEGSSAGSLIGFNYAYYPETDTMYSVMDFGAIKDLTALKKITLTVSGSTGKKIASTVMPSPQKNISKILWKLPSLKAITQRSNPSGQYVLTAEAQGIPGGKLMRKFERKVFEWEGNPYGKSDRLIEPFTPIQIDNNVLSTILRQHTVNSLGLWEQVIADGKELLDGKGMVLRVRMDGKDYDAEGTLKLVRHTDTQAVYQSTWQAGALQGKAVSTWDYDGTMRYRLTLEPTAKAIESVKLVIPVKKSLAYLFHACTDGLRFNYGGATPTHWHSSQAPRSSLQGSYVNYIWVGTETAGISIFGENDKGWVTNGTISAQELHLEGSTAYLTCNLVASKTVIGKPRTMDIGFLATPIKPMPENWRLSGFNLPFKYQKHFDYFMMLLGSAYEYGANLDSHGFFPRDNDYTLWDELTKTRRTKIIPTEFINRWLKGYRIKRLMPAYQRSMKYVFALLKNGGKNPTIAYTNPRGMYLDIPEARTFLDNWFREEFQATRDRKPEYADAQTYGVNPSESFRDFTLWHYHKMLTWGFIDNIYWDNIYLTANYDRDGSEGGYEMENGTFQPSVGLWSMRDLIRRTAIHMTELGKKPHNVIHMTNTAIAPIASFVQINYDWEDFGGTVPFQERYTPEYIRTLTIGRQFGNRPQAIGLVQKDTEEKLAICLRSKQGVMMTHEINAMPTSLYEFGYGRPNCKVWNYWTEGYPVSCDGKTTSILVSKPGAAHLILCNYDKKEQFRVVLDKKTIGLTGNITATNQETGDKLPVRGNIIEVPMKRYDFTHIFIQQQGK